MLREKELESQISDDLKQREFADLQEGVQSVLKRKVAPTESDNYLSTRRRLIDDTEKEEKLAQLKQVAPWVPQFTPEAKDALLKLPSKRPSSPMSGEPLRVKDLVPINLERETLGIGHETAGPVRFICPVSR